MIVFICIIALFHIVCCVQKPIYGLCTLLAIKILIPDTARIFSILSVNSFCSLVLFVTFLFHQFSYKISKQDKTIIQFIYLFLAFSLLVLLFTDYAPWDIQFNHIFQYFFLQFAPVIVGIVSIRTPKDLKLISNVLLYSIIICTLYGTICFVAGFNSPYNAWFAEYFPAARNANYDAKTEMAGIKGRIIGTSSSDSWSFGMVVAFYFMISYFISQYLKTNISKLCYILCFISVFLTVRRTPILTLMCFYFFMFILKIRNVRQLLKSSSLILGSLILMGVVIYNVPYLKPFLNIIEASFFFWDDSVSAMNDVSGSSVELRLYQLNYTISHISDSLLFGKGWGAMYVKEHPGMFGWESIIFTTLFQSGFLGLLITAGLFWFFYRYSVIRCKEKTLSKAFMLSSLVFCVVNDTIYPFYIYFGCVLINKMNHFEIVPRHNI